MVLVLCFFLVKAHAQHLEILRGHITDPKGKPIAGVDIVIVNVARTQSNKDGMYAFTESVTFPRHVRFERIGYDSKVIYVDSKRLSSDSTLNIQLFPSEVAVEEISVTGRRNNSYLNNHAQLGNKLSGSLKDLPQSVALVSKELMEDRQAFMLTDMVQDLAGVNQASAYDDLTIRGFNSGYTSGFRLVNGMRSGYGYGTSFWRTPLTANLESIEVLKGSGASLFGDIAPGGTVNLVTKKPLADKHGSIQFSIGSFQTFRSSLDVGGAIDSNRNVLYRLNLAYEDARTFRDKNQRTNLVIAPSFTFRPTESTVLDVDLTYDRFDGFLDRGLGIRNNNFYGQSRSFNVNQPTDFLRTSFLTLSTRLIQEISPTLSFHANYMKSMYKEELNEFRTLNTFANAPENTLMNMRFQSKKATDYTDNFVGYFRYKWNREFYKYQFVLGVDYAKYAGDPDNILREARSRRIGDQEIPLTLDLNASEQPVIDPSTYVWRQQAEFPFLNPYHSTGFYIQNQISIFERLKMILGLRHEYFRSSSADLLAIFQTAQHVWLPRFGLTFTLNPSINYFASYSKGYIPVGADFTYNFKDYGASQPFVSEDSYQLETGMKAAFLNNQLQTELSLYHIARNNMLLATGAISDTGFPIYRQSGRVISQGIEIDLRGQLSTAFQLTANYSFNRTNVLSSTLPGEVGQPLPNAPRNTAGIWIKYAFLQNKLKGFGLGMGINYVDKRRMDNASSIMESGERMWDQWPSYTVANTAVYYHFGKLRLAVNVNNVFDTYYYLGGFDYTRGFVGSPRNVMISVSSKF